MVPDILEAEFERESSSLEAFDIALAVNGAFSGLNGADTFEVDGSGRIGGGGLIRVPSEG